MSQRMEYWIAHLSSLDAEGISTKAYAEREGLSVASLYYWRKRVKSAKDASKISRRFVAVQVEPSPQPISCALVLGPGVRLELGQLPTPAWLAALGMALRSGAV